MTRNDHYTVFYERARVLTGRSNWHRALYVGYPSPTRYEPCQVFLYFRFSIGGYTAMHVFFATYQGALSIFSQLCLSSYVIHNKALAIVLHRCELISLYRSVHWL